MPKTAAINYPVRLFAVPQPKRCAGAERGCWGYFESIAAVVEACGPGARHYPYPRLLPVRDHTEVLLDMRDGSKRRYRKFATWDVVSPRCGLIQVAELELLCDPELCPEGDRA
ncbi:hypothetical protein [Oceanithermus sp.]|uniref:hypothetical protein n=1 Tax=Oceanithermus sp. TaxID=2268145 RepID=UPI0025D190FC|nr:hypothetical protein [Oceanithermus sp.]